MRRTLIHFLRVNKFFCWNLYQLGFTSGVFVGSIIPLHEQRFLGQGNIRTSVYSQSLNNDVALEPGAKPMGKLTHKTNAHPASFTESDQVFESAAEIFRVMAAPLRLKIISSLCNGEKNVSQLLHEISTTQPNMSQHLNMLYQNGIIGKRREGVQIFYRIVNDRVVTLCRAVCTQIAIETESDNGR